MTTAAQKKQAEKREVVWGSAKEVAEKQNRGFMAVMLPSGVQQFRFKNADRNYDLDVIPYIAGACNPEVEEGRAAYALIYYLHQGVGPDEKSYICLSHNKPSEACPRCEQIDEMLKKGQITKSEHKAMGPKQRQLFRVRDRDDKNKGIQILEDQFWMGGLGQQISQAMNSYDADDARCQFYKLGDGGYYLRVGTQNVAWKNEDSGKGGSRVRPTRVDFIEREKPLSADFLTEDPDLEDLVRKSRLSYDALKKICYGKVDPKAVNDEDPRSGKAKDEDGDEEAPPKKKTPAKDEEEAPPKKNKAKDEEEAPPKKNKAKDDGDEFEAGQVVSFTNPKDEDEVLEGTIKRIDDDNKLAVIMIDGVKYTMDWSDLTLTSSNGEDEDAKPAKKGKAKDEDDAASYSVGDYVNHAKFGKCEIIKLNKDEDGKIVDMRLEDADKDFHSNIKPATVTPWKKSKDDDEEEKPAKAKAAKDKDEDEEAPPKRKK